MEAPCSRLQGIFDRKKCGLFRICLLTPPQAAGYVLAFAVQILSILQPISLLDNASSFWRNSFT
jgi:hypothetical protein